MSDPSDRLLPNRIPIGSDVLQPRQAQTEQDSVPKKKEPSRPWNPWALPAFGAALGTTAYGILGSSFVVMIPALILTLFLAAKALTLGRRYEWAGKGFAITALVLGALAALITLVALLAGA